MCGGDPVDGVVLPGEDALRAVLAALDRAGIVAAVGGSALLAARGLIDRVRDWDVTTDADPVAVRAALDAQGIPYTVQTSADAPYATRARLRVDGGDDVDLIVGFAADVGGEIVGLPTRVSGHWRGLPLADPVVWAHAYRLIGRPHRAASLEDQLHDRADRTE